MASASPQSIDLERPQQFYSDESVRHANLSERPISHETLRAFYEIESLMEPGALYVASVDPSHSQLPGWISAICPSSIENLLVEQIRHLRMTLTALKQPRTQSTLFLDCTCWFSHIALVMSCFRRGQLFYLPMYDQQLAGKSLFRRLSLRFMRMLLRVRRSKVILFEHDDECLPASLRFPTGHRVVMPMPRSTTFSARKSRDANVPLRVGVGGMIRSGKGTLDQDFLDTIISATEASRDPIDLVAGFPSWQGGRPQLPLGIEYVDTTEYGDYRSFIESLDVLIVNLREDDYWYRTSGVVQDAASAGVFVIVNDYPVVRSQIKFPVEIGTVYSDLQDLSNILRNLPDHIGLDLDERMKQWNLSRSAEHLQQILMSRTMCSNGLFL